MRFSDLDGRRIALWGLARETRSLLQQVDRRGLDLEIAAVIADDPHAQADEAAARGLRILSAADAGPVLAGCDVLVRSPGVSIYRPELRAAADAGTAITTATGLWLAERTGVRTIGVTGTKGKSTTATILAQLLRAAGAPVELAGNIGRPALDLLDSPATTWTVLELSSYQTADLMVGPQIALVTNLFREHTDWHRGEANYRRDKLRLTALPEVRAAVMPPDLEPPGPTRVVRFGTPQGWSCADGAAVHADGARVEADELALPGSHNLLNLCAALTALDIALDAPRPAPSPRGVAALPHRLQAVLEREGVLWVDDSISTTPQSTIAALEAFAGRPIVLIAGGNDDRRQDFSALGPVLARHGVAVIGLPSNGPRVVRTARAAGVSPERALTADDMAGAVAEARRLVPAGGVVLLSPAAPSYGIYRDFEQRGEHFARLARET